MAQRKGLGRGVDALIPSAATRKAASKKKEEKPEVQVVEKEVVKEVVKEVKVPADTNLPVSSIEPNRNQPRKNFDKAELEELADSIKRYGVIQPLVVQKKNDYYEIIAGERRWRAAKLAKLKEVPVVIKEYEPQEASEIALIENLQRSDLCKFSIRAISDASCGSYSLMITGTSLSLANFAARHLRSPAIIS